MSVEEKDEFYIDSIPIDSIKALRQLYRTPGSDQLIQWIDVGDPVPVPPAGIAKWEDSREYYLGEWKGKPAFFKRTLRISKDMIEEHGFSVALTTKVIAQNLFLCRGIAGVPELYAYDNETVVMEFKHGITIKQAVNEGLFDMQYLDGIYPQLMGSIGLIRDRMRGHGRIFDLSFNNLLIDPLVNPNYFAWVDFDPSLRGLAVLTIAEFLILLARNELVFNEVGTMIWNPEIYPDVDERSSSPETIDKKELKEIDNLPTLRDYYDIGDVTNDTKQAGT